MKVIEQSFKVEGYLHGEEMIQNIERIGRTCYKSEDRITTYSAEKFVRTLIENGHDAMIEHESITLRIFTDRGVSHELVRHRIASYAQESTRYCNYSKEKFGGLTFIKPVYWEEDSDEYCKWVDACRASEASYLSLINYGSSPQEARAVLNNSLKTEIVVTMNLRAWRHFLKLRTAMTAHPQMRELARKILEYFKSVIPVVFDDIMV